MIVMMASEFISRLKDIADNYKTLYVMGCFGSPLTSSIKERYIKTEHYDYNNKAERVKMIRNASSDTFGFDCVNLIKGVLWGWDGNKSKTYGGAIYKDHDIPDVGANQMIKLCSPSKDFSSIEPGEVVWLSGHIGVYIGEGKVIECSPKWNNGVQVSNLGNIEKYKTGHYRIWTSHGKLPWIDYSVDDGSAWSKEDRKWAVDNGLIVGNGGSFDWTSNITKEQLIAVLRRFREAFIK